MRSTGLTLLLALSLPACAVEGSEPGAVSAGGQLRSLQPLLKEAEGYAKKWSKKARLYTVMGTGPKNEARLKPEVWTLVFGDPSKKAESFLVAFKDGKLAWQRPAPDKAETAPLDYKLCRPLDPKFLDTAGLEKRVTEKGLEPNQWGQLDFVLFKPASPDCGGLFDVGMVYRVLEGIPLKQFGKAVWVAVNDSEKLYFDGITGRFLGRFPPEEQKE